MVMGLGIRSQIKREGKGTISGECRAGKVRQGLETGRGRAQGRPVPRMGEAQKCRRFLSYELTRALPLWVYYRQPMVKKL